MDDNWIMGRLMFLVPLLLSLSIHEFAHAWSAWRLGDDTAKQMGRLTLNPLAHIDPVGTVLLPLMGVPFGWAKPVPINPLRFRRDVDIRKGIVISAAAGPISNLMVAAVSAFGIFVLAKSGAFGQGWVSGLFMFLEIMVFMNVILAFFNAIPVPPLDGSRVADGLMPDRLRSAWDRYCRLGPFLLIGLILMPSVFGVSFMDWPVKMTLHLLKRLYLM